jgi:hypothetical protein
MSLVSANLLDEDGNFVDDSHAELIHSKTKQTLQLEKLCQLMCGFKIYAESVSNKLDRIREGMNGVDERLRRMRIAYINGDIKDEKAYLRKLVKDLTNTQSNTELMLVYEMLVACLIERLREVCECSREAFEVSDVDDWLSFTTRMIYYLRQNGDAISHQVGGEVYGEYNLSNAFVIQRPQNTHFERTFMTTLTKQPDLYEQRTNYNYGEAVERFLRRVTPIVAEMVEVANYADHQLTQIGQDFAIIPVPCSVPTMTLDVDDETVQSFVSRGFIVPNCGHAKVFNMEYNLIRSNLVQNFGLGI